MTWTSARLRRVTHAQRGGPKEFQTAQIYFVFFLHSCLNHPLQHDALTEIGQRMEWRLGSRLKGADGTEIFCYNLSSSWPVWPVNGFQNCQDQIQNKMWPPLLKQLHRKQQLTLKYVPVIHAIYDSICVQNNSDPPTNIVGDPCYICFYNSILRTDKSTLNMYTSFWTYFKMNKHAPVYIFT